jgi:hypothetical protein
MFFEVLHQSPAGTVDDALRLAGRAAGVHDEQRMVEGQLLELENVSVGIGPAEVQEFRVENLISVSSKYDVVLVVNERENNDLGTML